MFRACFAGDMLLDAEGGKKRADAIQVGDRLWARDESDPAGPLALKEVEEVFVRSAPLWNLHVAGQRLKTTAEHPFYVVGQGWVPAGMLQIGDRLLTQDGRAVPVEGVAPSGQRVTVYNWRIAEYHTYYVSAAETSPSLWAHNADYNVTGEAAASERGPLRGRMGNPPAGMQNPQAHHDLPQAFRDQFERAGLDIDNPAYGRWVEGSPPGRHQNWSYEFNQEWRAFFRRKPNPSRQEILDQMNRLRADPRFQ
jgi:hypothetical protein